MDNSNAPRRAEGWTAIAYGPATRIGRAAKRARAKDAFGSVFVPEFPVFVNFAMGNAIRRNRADRRKASASLGERGPRPRLSLHAGQQRPRRAATSFWRISASPDEERLDAGLGQPPAIARARRCRSRRRRSCPAGTSGISRSHTSSEVSKVRRSRLLTPISRPSSASARSSSRFVVDLDEHVEPEVVRGLVQRARGFVVDRGHDDEDAVGAPGARLQHLIGIEQEILAQDRQRRRRARLHQMLGRALERRRVGEHRKAGRAARLIGPGEPRRLEILADQPLRRARLLDFGDEPEAPRLDRALERLDEAARRRLVADFALQRRRAARAPSPRRFRAACRPRSCAGCRSCPHSITHWRR